MKQYQPLKGWQLAVSSIVVSVIGFVLFYAANYLHPDSIVPIRVKEIPWASWYKTLGFVTNVIGVLTALLILASFIAKVNDAFWLSKGGSLSYRIKRAFVVAWIQVQCSFYAFMYRHYSNRVENYLVSGGKGKVKHYESIAYLVRKRGYCYDKYWHYKSKL